MSSITLVVKVVIKFWRHDVGGEVLEMVVLVMYTGEIITDGGAIMVMVILG